MPTAPTALALLLAAALAGADHGVHDETPLPAPRPAEEAAAAPSAAPKPAVAESANPSNAQALQRLMEGNARYCAGKPIRPRQDAAARAAVAEGQKPFAAIVCCADSRVPPEILFDQGLGDLFVVRLAGNVIEDEGLASLEYAVEHLGVKLVMVVGHERCGAIKAACAGGEAPGHLPKLLEHLAPAVAAAKGQPGDLVDNAVVANARLAAQQIRASKPILERAVTRGELAVLAARYDLDTGDVKVLW